MRAPLAGTLVGIAALAGAQPALAQTLRPKEVRFDALDVVRDRAGDAPQRIGEFAAGCPVAKDATQWKDCERFPDAKTDKNWPFVATAGTHLKIENAVIAIRRDGGRPLRDAAVTGTASFGGRALRWKTRATLDERDGVLETGPMTSDRKLPDRVARRMTIRWKVKAGGRAYAVRNSTHPLYVVHAKPTATPWLSLVDLTSRAADGKTTTADVFEAIWFEFESRAIHPRALDPVTGGVSVERDVLRYWTPWTLLDDYIALSGLMTCPKNAGTAGILKDRVGRCGSWAPFFSDALGVQGLAATPRSVRSFPDAPTGPPGARLMLIKTWTFSGPPRPGADPSFPFQTEINIPDAGPRSFGALRQALDAPGVAGQGREAVPNPPGWFAVGDHALAIYDAKIYDPSYGSGPFDDIRAWALASLAGYARLTVRQEGATTIVTIHAHRGVP